MDKDTTKMKRSIICAIGEWFEALWIRFHASDIGRWWYYFDDWKKVLSWVGLGVINGILLSYNLHGTVHRFINWAGW